MPEGHTIRRLARTHTRRFVGEADAHGNRRPRRAPEPRGQVRMRLVGATGWADLRGPIACEVLTEGEVQLVRGRLGADPLRDDTDPETAWGRVSRSRAPIATLLMDQSVVAGVGNVYRAEVLFRHGLDPLLPGREHRRAVPRLRDRGGPPQPRQPQPVLVPPLSGGRLIDGPLRNGQSGRYAR